MLVLLVGLSSLVAVHGRLHPAATASATPRPVPVGVDPLVAPRRLNPSPTPQLGCPAHATPIPVAPGAAPCVLFNGSGSPWVVTLTNPSVDDWEALPEDSSRGLWRPLSSRPDCTVAAGGALTLVVPTPPPASYQVDFYALTYFKVTQQSYSVYFVVTANESTACVPQSVSHFCSADADCSRAQGAPICANLHTSYPGVGACNGV